MSEPVRTVPDAERRARLGVRHALARAVADPVAAARAVVCLHATEPASVYLAAHARCGAGRREVDRALYDERSLVRQLAMRRTVFAFPRELLPAVRGSAAARVATQQAALLARTVVAGGLATDGADWVARACAGVLDLLHEAPAGTTELRARLPLLQLRLPAPERGPGAAPTPVAARVLTVLAATGSVVRGRNDGGWHVSRPVWTPVETWLGEPAEPLEEGAGYAELVRRWLWSFGPGSEDDVVWWLGATRAAVRRALDEVGAVQVRLEDGTPAWLHPDDVDEVAAPDPWVALLPALDPTTMGWRGRGFHVEAAIAASVYDRAGNGGPTAWCDGRIVGGWRQRADGAVVLVLTARCTTRELAALRRAARALTGWLDGHVLRSAFQQPVD